MGQTVSTVSAVQQKAQQRSEAIDKLQQNSQQLAATAGSFEQSAKTLREQVRRQPGPGLFDCLKRSKDAKGAQEHPNGPGWSSVMRRWS